MPLSPTKSNIRRGTRWVGAPCTEPAHAARVPQELVAGGEGDDATLRQQLQQARHPPRLGSRPAPPRSSLAEAAPPCSTAPWGGACAATGAAMVRRRPPCSARRRCRRRRQLARLRGGALACSLCSLGKLLLENRGARSCFVAVREPRAAKIIWHVLVCFWYHVRCV